MAKSTARIVKRTAIDYRDSRANLQGILVSAESQMASRPGVVLFPDARGIGDHAVECAERLAALGFVVLVADLYGGGVKAQDMGHAMELMKQLRSDAAGWRARADAARTALTSQAMVDSAKLAAIGYCFGGTTALELARSGAALDAVISFHGGLTSERPADACRIKAKVLVCHGAADRLVPPPQLAAFENEMAKTDVDWQVNVYGGAAHSFTNPEASSAGVPELAYHATADRRSWAAMLNLFEEVFGPPPY
ncbi:dienelactone hydrolase family protein [Bradyrhizobium manausense]